MICGIIWKKQQIISNNYQHLGKVNVGYIAILVILKYTYIKNSASHRHFLGSKTSYIDINQFKI